MMNRILQAMAAFFGAIPDALRPYKWPVALFVLLGTIFLGIGITRFQLDTSIDAWLSDSDPAVQALDEFRRQFGSDDGLFLVYQAKDGDVFSPESLTAIRHLTEMLENWQDLDPEELGISRQTLEGLSHMTRVRSLTNVRYQQSDADTLESRLLVAPGDPVTPEAADAARRIAAGQTNMKLLFFSDDGAYGAIVLSTDFGTIPVDDGTGPTQDFSADQLDLAAESFDVAVDPNATVADVEFRDTQPAEYLDFINALKAIYSQPEFKDNFTFYPIGTAGMMDFSMQTMIQAGLLLLGSVVIIILLLYTLFHTGSAVLWPVLTVVSSGIWVLGGMSWLGIAQTQLISLTGMLVLAVGVADCIHVLSEYLLFKREGQSHEQAMREAYRKTGVPILLTSVTTMAGMLAIAFGGFGQFVVFGVTSALAVFAALVFTYTVLPVLLEFWHPHPTEQKKRSAGNAAVRRVGRIVSAPVRAIKWVSARTGLTWLLSAVWLQPLLERIPAFSYRARYPIVIVFFAAFVVTVIGATQVRIDSNLVELFKKGTPIRTAYEIVDKHMAGTGSMEIMLDFGASDAFTDAEVLKAVERLQNELKARYGDYIVRTHSLADLVKETNRAMNGDDPAFERIPDDSLAVSQLLFLFNSSNPEDRRGLVSDDYSRSHISIQLRNAGSHEYASIFRDLDSVIHDNFTEFDGKYPGWKVELTGTFALMMRMADTLATNQVRSLTLAVVIISLILTLTLGSVQGGLLAIVPNVLPVSITFGLMGLLGVPLDTDTLMIAPLIIGIAVDDTIHFVTHYRMALAAGRSATEALTQTIREVGQAVTFTSLVLGTAFAMLSFSAYLGIAKVGIFGSLAIFVALLCDLLFLPALIYIFQPKFGVKTAGMAHFKVREQVG